MAIPGVGAFSGMDQPPDVQAGFSPPPLAPERAPDAPPPAPAPMIRRAPTVGTSPGAHSPAHGALVADGIDPIEHIQTEMKRIMGVPTLQDIRLNFDASDFEKNDRGTYLSETYHPTNEHGKAQSKTCLKYKMQWRITATDTNGTVHHLNFDQWFYTAAELPGKTYQKDAASKNGLMMARGYYSVIKAIVNGQNNTAEAEDKTLYEKINAKARDIMAAKGIHLGLFDSDGNVIKSNDNKTKINNVQLIFPDIRNNEHVRNELIPIIKNIRNIFQGVKVDDLGFLNRDETRCVVNDADQGYRDIRDSNEDEMRADVDPSKYLEFLNQDIKTQKKQLETLAAHFKNPNYNIIGKRHDEKFRLTATAEAFLPQPNDGFLTKFKGFFDFGPTTSSIPGLEAAVVAHNTQEDDYLPIIEGYRDIKEEMEARLDTLDKTQHQLILMGKTSEIDTIKAKYHRLLTDIDDEFQKVQRPPEPPAPPAPAAGPAPAADGIETIPPTSEQLARRAKARDRAANRAAVTKAQAKAEEARRVADAADAASGPGDFNAQDRAPRIPDADPDTDADDETDVEKT